MPAAVEPRYRKRVPCRLQFAGGAHRGMVLNVSRSGLFVQTTAGASPGDAIHLELALGSDELPVDARVVWRRVVAPHLRTVSTGGMGLHIQYASDGWYGFLAGLAATGSEEDAAPTPAAAPVRDAGPAFRVRLRLRGSPRTRTLVVAARDAKEARARARQQAGGDWRVLELAKLPRPD
jgi:hypothetical protein